MRAAPVSLERAVPPPLPVVLLALFTVAAAVFATFNSIQESNFQTPTDGIWWVESNGGLQAQRVNSTGPGERAGLKAGDLLVRANGVTMTRWADLSRQIFATRAFNTINYTIARDGVRLEVPVILDAQDRSFNAGFRLIALVYLGIGLYVLFRRWTAPHSTHFYIFCLASFVLYSFKYTGDFNTFDQIIFWSNIFASGLQPALFVHFALAFANENRRRRPWLTSLVYAPGAFLVGLYVFAVVHWSATEALRHRLDQLLTGYEAAFYVLAAVILWNSYRHPPAPLRRQQLKWLTRGTIVAIAPFTLLSALPFLTNVAIPDFATKLTGLALLFLPLTFAWAIVRYRLMDTDLIFKRGVTYTLATATLVGLYFALVALAAEVVHKRIPNAGYWGLIAAIIITAQ